jgi:HD-GYP domain-containing protein (c-di-GMP phosphodiesterase class II)
VTQSGGPQGHDWADVAEGLHSLTNAITVRSHYAEGHPAIQRADDLAATQLAGLLSRIPELVLALIDDEFVVCERPMPELRKRIALLADAMLRHEVECIVVQRGVTSAECTIVGQTLATRDLLPGEARELARARLTHVGFRFAEKRKKGAVDAAAHDAQDFVPAVHAVLAGVGQAVAARVLVDCLAVRAIAEEIVVACELRTFSLLQRCHVDGASDDAAHAVNVAMMTAAMALDARLGDADCVDVTAAALLHDVGHMFMPARVRGIPEPLLDAEGRAVLRHHPYAGASALLTGGCPPLWVAAALEHHRGVDGQGYPSLDPGEAPHELVRLVALANYVDRRRTLLQGTADTADEAIRRAVSLADAYFGRPAIGHYLRALGSFPPGTTVELSDRQSAVVIAANAGDPRRPIVRVLSPGSEDRRVDLKLVDAVEGRHVLSIVKAIPPPIFVRPVDAADVELAAPEATRLPSLAPTAGGVSVPPAARMSGQYARIVVPPPVVSSIPPAAAAATPEEVEQRYLKTLGPLSRIARPGRTPEEMARLPLDHFAGYMLTFVDGASTLETIVDASGLPRLEALRILRDLVASGAIALS